MKYLLRVIIFLLILCLNIMPAFSQDEDETPLSELDIDELREKILKEDPKEFLSYSIGDSNVSLVIMGSWMGGFTFNPGFSVSPMGIGFFSPQTPFLFRQEADITLSLWINDRWFIEANFQDSGENATAADYINTYRAGYEGFPGEFFQYAGIGNTGLDFPSFPYLDLGGDSASSFGFYSRFGPENLTFHALVRYDTSSREERIFSGTRERAYHYMQPGSFVRGISFVLPDENITSEIIVYIEDAHNGGMIDKDGRRWRLALPGEYAAGRINGLLELSVRAGAMVAVSYSAGADSRPWAASMGSSYQDAGKFLNAVQNWFGSSFNLENFPQCGNRDDDPSNPKIPGEVVFGNVYALVIYEPGTFSPFERLNIYNPPAGAQDAAIVTLSSGTEVKGFRLTEKNSMFAGFNSENDAANAGISTYELLKEGSSAFYTGREFESIWPLAKQYPEIYVQASGVFSGDITLRFSYFGAASGGSSIFYIGPDVISGSVQVYRSGIQETQFSYNSSTGEVTIHGAVSENEYIRITYLKKSPDSNSGSLAAGFAAVYNKNEFTALGAAGIRWNFSDSAFSENNHSNMGTIGISAKTAWDYSFLKAHAAGAFTFSQTDTTGLYRVTGMEGNESVLSLPAESSFVSNPPASKIISTFLIEGGIVDYELKIENRAELVYRNYHDNNFFGSSIMPIEWNAPVIEGINRPYPAKDSRLKTNVVVAEFILDNTRRWTGFQVPLVFSDGVLERAREIEIPYRLYGFDAASLSNMEIIIQIGSLSGRDSLLAENMELVWEGSIYTDKSGASVYSDGEYRIARFVLNEDDRKKLTNAKYLRIIVLNTGSSQTAGRIALSPPVTRGTSFRTVTLESGRISANSGNVSAVEILEGGVNRLETFKPDIINKLHQEEKNTQRVLQVEWNGLEQDTGAGIDGRFYSVPLSDYRKLSFFYKSVSGDYVAANGNLVFIIAPGADSINEPFLKVQIPLNVFTKDKWSMVTIRYQGSETGVYVDGIPVDEASLIYNPRRVFTPETASDYETGRTSYIAIIINPGYNQTLENGSAYIDEIILEDAVNLYRLNAGASIEYNKPGTMLSFNGLAVLSDFSAFTAVESEARINNEESESRNVQGSAAGRAGASISVLGTKIAGNFSYTAAPDLFLWKADHSISGTYGFFSFKETFNNSGNAPGFRHNINVSVNSDFHLSLSADALFDQSQRIRQNWSLDTGYRSSNVYIPVIAFKTDAAFIFDRPDDGERNYFYTWVNTFYDLVPNAGDGAQSRKTQSQIALSMRTQPVGAALTADGKTNYTGINNALNLENSLFINIPVILERIHFNLRMGRSFTRNLKNISSDVFNDTGKLFESVNDFAPFWGIFPFYSLFTDDTDSAMDKSIYASPSRDFITYSSFKDHYSAVINLGASYDLFALFIPSSLSFRIERTVDQRMDTRSDSLTLGGSLGFQAINMFGAMGYAPLFTFYMADEYSHLIDWSVTVPKESGATWRIQSILNAGFRGFTGGILNFKNIFAYGSDGSWRESFLTAWEAPTKRSLTSIIYGWITSALVKQSSWFLFASQLADYEQLRRESLEISFNGSNDSLVWTASLGHEEIVRIQGTLNFSTFAKLSFSQNTHSGVFTFDVQLGTAVRIIF